MRDTLWLVHEEAMKAEARFGHFHSAHEGYGVLAEECAELLEAIRANDAAKIEHEAVQVSAVALRIAQSMSVEETRKRSGCE